MYYLYDGATGSDIGTDCIGVYQYIVDNYKGQPIWMFGLSRGAFTVRCVAGMINNCGIVDSGKSAAGILDEDGTSDSICQEVYKIYRSPHKDDKPNTIKMRNFKNRFGHAEVPGTSQIKFMGLIDTVGSLGIPRLNPGVTAGGEWPEFHDQEVSSVVEKVYHARSLHDRLWIFQPCRASRDIKHRGKQHLFIEEKWFPGCHYDLGRQRFKFIRTGTGPGISWTETIVSFILSPLTRVVKPNEAIADLVLKWMFDRIVEEAGGGLTFYEQRDVERVQHADVALTPDALEGGSGDVYSVLYRYIPGARIFPGNSLWWILSAIPGLKFVAETVLAVNERRISCGVLPQGAPGGIGESMVKTQIHDYNAAHPVDVEDIEAAVKRRYPSRTYEMHQRFCCGQH